MCENDVVWRAKTCNTLECSESLRVNQDRKLEGVVRVSEKFGPVNFENWREVSRLHKKSENAGFVLE